MNISLKNVLGGWQTMIEDATSGSVFAVGPVHKSTREAWAWQEKNIRKVTE